MLFGGFLIMAGAAGSIFGIGIVPMILGLLCCIVAALILSTS
jgi:hypothetical protein